MEFYGKLKVTSPGNLYIVATPIGNLGDISHRALDILRQVDLIAVEDTRHSQGLLSHYSISTKMVALFDQVEQARLQPLIEKLQAGESIALISDAGTPLIRDPGYAFVNAALAAEIKVVPIPGACALIAALSVSGLACEKFTFEGFLPVKSAARRARFELLVNESRTLVFYEAPHRICDFVEDVVAIMGSDREVVIAREITKVYETIYRDRAQAVLQWLRADHNQQKGEFVVLIAGCAENKDLCPETIRIFNLLLKDLPLKRAAKIAAEITGKRKNDLYKWAIDQQS